MHNPINPSVNQLVEFHSEHMMDLICWNWKGKWKLLFGIDH